jgi:hypothetical protein
VAERHGDNLRTDERNKKCVKHTENSGNETKMNTITTETREEGQEKRGRVTMRLKLAREREREREE